MDMRKQHKAYGQALRVHVKQVLLVSAEMSFVVVQGTDKKSAVLSCMFFSFLAFLF